MIKGKSNVFFDVIKKKKTLFINTMMDIIGLILAKEAVILRLREWDTVEKMIEETWFL